MIFIQSLQLRKTIQFQLATISMRLSSLANKRWKYLKHIIAEARPQNTRESVNKYYKQSRNVKEQEKSAWTQKKNTHVSRLHSVYRSKQQFSPHQAWFSHARRKARASDGIHSMCYNVIYIYLGILGFRSDSSSGCSSFITVSIVIVRLFSGLAENRSTRKSWVSLQCWPAAAAAAAAS